MRTLPLSVSLAITLVLPAILDAENWPWFRGPSRQGISRETGLPLAWGPDKNILWATDIPGLGWSSPTVWENRVFLTTATDDGTTARVLALDAASGRILWDRALFEQPTELKRRQNSFATPTAATDGERVYAVFPGGLAALDFDGNVVWINRDFVHRSEHGLGASPVLWKDLLIMPYDGNDLDNPQIGWKIPWEAAKLVALDKRSGKVRWIGKRGKSRIAHVTPNVIEVNGTPQLVSAAGDVIQGFDLENGERLWSVYSQGEGVVPSVVVGGGLAFVSSGFEASTIRAVRPGGQIAWEQTRNVSHIPSFLLVEPHLYVLHESGTLAALEAASGDVVYQQRVGGAFWSSPVHADGRIYVLDEECTTTVIAPGPDYKELAKNSLPGRCQASMAVSGGRLFIRSAEKLWAIGK